MSRLIASLPFIENRTRVLGTAVFISLLCHGLLLEALGMAYPLLTTKTPEDTGISIDLAIVQTAAAEPAPPEPAAVAEPVAQPEVKEVPVAQPMPETAPTPKKVAKEKPKQESKKVAQKKMGETRDTRAPTQQSGNQLVASRAKLDAPRGITTAPAPAGGSNTPKPPYPDLARKRGQEGTVNVRCQVDSSGVVTGVSLAKSSGFRLLDEAAMKAVSKWKFKPGKKDGMEVAGTVVVPVQFKLQ